MSRAALAGRQAADSSMLFARQAGRLVEHAALEQAKSMAWAAADVASCTVRVAIKRVAVAFINKAQSVIQEEMGKNEEMYSTPYMTRDQIRRSEVAKLIAFAVAKAATRKAMAAAHKAIFAAETCRFLQHHSRSTPKRTRSAGDLRQHVRTRRAGFVRKSSMCWACSHRPGGCRGFAP